MKWSHADGAASRRRREYAGLMLYVLWHYVLPVWALALTIGVAVYTWWH
jgi:hypothetical protein